MGKGRGLNMTVTTGIGAERRAQLSTGPIARLERMIEIRGVEDAILKLFADGHVRGSTHTTQGQEAVSVALASVLETSDLLTCTYRGHAMALALGMTAEAVLGEVLGRTVGSIGGDGRSAARALLFFRWLLLVRHGRWGSPLEGPPGGARPRPLWPRLASRPCA